MRKIRTFLTFFATILSSTTSCCFISSCSTNSHLISEPTEKTFYSSINVDDDNNITTHCLIGMFFSTRISDFSTIKVVAEEKANPQTLGQLNPIIEPYNEISFYIDLQIENNFCYAKDYKVALSFYINDELIQNPSIYTIQMQTALVPNKDRSHSTPTWDYDNQKILYAPWKSVATICHPISQIFVSDFNIQINYFDPLLKSAEIINKQVVNNQLLLQFNFSPNNVSSLRQYDIELSMNYKNLPETKKILSCIFNFEKNGWDVEPYLLPEKKKITIPWPGAFTKTVIINNYVLCGFDDIVTSGFMYQLSDPEKKPIKGTQLVFNKANDTNLPLYSLSITFDGNVPDLENEPFGISFSNFEKLDFNSGYFVTIT